MTRAVAIYEMGVCDTWQVSGQGNYRLTANLPTAAQAIRLVQLEDERTALLSGQNIVTVVTWHPRSGIGRRAVQAIAGGGK